METLHKELYLVEKILSRHATRLGSSSASLSAASYIATKWRYRGVNFKRSIREGKQILVNLTEKENEYE